ncbi:MAG TPA: PaaI family thioesterase [Solirubrobacterales bacterium]|nr:PaaI family thioesterase [Solirubrobacterales bacterium]
MVRRRHGGAVFQQHRCLPDAREPRAGPFGRARHGLSLGRGAILPVAEGLVSLADSVAAWQTLRHLPPGHGFTTVEMKLNVFAAGKPGDALVATAEHLHAGGSTHVVEVRVHCDERLVANLLVTQFVLPPP